MSDVELEAAVDSWIKHQTIMHACGLVANPRNDLERTFEQLQRKDMRRQQQKQKWPRGRGGASK